MAHVLSRNSRDSPIPFGPVVASSTNSIILRTCARTGLPSSFRGVVADQPIEVRGFKYLLGVMPMLQRLRGSGCARDLAGNRTLLYDQYVALVLVALFSPGVQAMRTICRASNLKKVQKKLGVKRVSRWAASASPATSLTRTCCRG